MKINDNTINIDVKVVPNSSKNSISVEEDFLKIKLTAPPVDNKANSSLIEFMAKQLKVPKTSILIINGQTAKNKRISIPYAAKNNLETLINSN